jgi:hypothetical protein
LPWRKQATRPNGRRVVNVTRKNLHFEKQHTIIGS